MKTNVLFIAFTLFTLPTLAQVDIGEDAPDFDLIVLDTNGQDKIQLSDLSGSVVYIFFYKADCSHCNQNGGFTEAEIHQKFINEENFVAIGLDTGDLNESSNRAFRSTTGITYPLLLNGKTSLNNYYGDTSSYDRSVVVDAEGKVAYKGIGWVSTDYEDVATAIQAELDKLTVSAEDESFDNPEGIALYQNYPNPFNPSTNISFNLDASSQVSLKIYNVLGSEVATLANGVLPSGNHSFTWDASAFPSGIYLYRLTTETSAFNRKMLLVK